MLIYNKRSCGHLRILIVDDDASIRALLSRTLKNWGHEVIIASDGLEAWNILNSEPISFVVSDWLMPKMDGLELCQRIRAVGFSRYIYFILLTAKDAKDELIKGMEAGADDFVVKPFNKGELKVRIRAGERIVKLEQDLELRNEKLLETNAKLNKAYSRISKDLQAASVMQKSLLPATAMTLYNYHFDWIFNPASFIAGDIFNFFLLDDLHIGFYVLDVAGHGIPAAMLSVTLSKIMTPTPFGHRPLKHFAPNPPHYEISSPAQVVDDLNQRFQNKQDAMQYFTMAYGIIEILSGKVMITQAGHPSPILLNNANKASFIGTGGFPVGMMEKIAYEEDEFTFHVGNRLFLYSDGITECFNKNREQFSEERLQSLLIEWAHLPLRQLLNNLESALNEWKNESDFDDDITLLAIERL